MLRTVLATRYSTPLREGGSVPAVMEADDDGLYVVKFRGAAQGPKALVAEVIAGGIGRELGLLVPEVVLVDFDPALGRAEPDTEIKELLERSGGINVGLDFLPGALEYTPAGRMRVDPAVAADVVWFDAFVTNVDRTPRNPNLLMWHGRLWLIDHGASLYIQHTWRDPGRHARGRFQQVRDHVLLPVAGSLAEADARLASRIEPDMLRSIAADVPDDWFTPEPGLPDAEAHRAAYVDYLMARLAAPRPWADEAEDARRAA